MDSFIHLAGDSWNFWSPFPPAVNFLADRYNGPAFTGGNHPRRQLRIERCGTRGCQRLDLVDISVGRVDRLGKR